MPGGYLCIGLRFKHLHAMERQFKKNRPITECESMGRTCIRMNFEYIEKKDASGKRFIRWTSVAD